MSFQDRFDKFDAIWDYSNPLEAQKKAFKIYGDKAILYRSKKKDKKYSIVAPDGKIVSFGQMGFEDFTKHNDANRQMKFLNRSLGTKGNWKQNPYSPNWLSIRLLW